MLSPSGPASRACPGPSRRRFLSLGLAGGLSLANVFKARAESPAGRPKAAILIFLSGGPSHLDTWDMKPDLPVESRGEFQPIKSRVPGMEFCELMPLSAKVADRFAIVRGVQTVGYHTGNEFFSGYAYEEGNAGKPKGDDRPAFGSIVSRLREGPSAVPNYISLHDIDSWEHALYAGAAHKPFRFHAAAQYKESLENLSLSKLTTPARLHDRKDLLRKFDGLSRDLEAGGAFEAADAFTAKALELVTSGKVRDAFDVSKEPQRVRDLYGDKPVAFDFVPGHLFLQARRLVEAGVAVVAINLPGWDTHEKNFKVLRQQLPAVDRAWYALLEDLRLRGLDGDVVVLMGGEMGRTPKITRDREGGREHWPETGLALFAGGGLKDGPSRRRERREGEAAEGQPRPAAAPDGRPCITRWASTRRRPSTTTAAGRSTCSTTASRSPNWSERDEQSFDEPPPPPASRQSGRAADHTMDRVLAARLAPDRRAVRLIPENPRCPTPCARPTPARSSAAPTGPPSTADWDFALDPEAAWAAPGEVDWDRTIRVPFAPETAASGVGDTGFYKACWYRRDVRRPPASAAGRPAARSTSGRWTTRPPSGRTAGSSPGTRAGTPRSPPT